MENLSRQATQTISREGVRVITELQPRYNSQKSFYKKAHVIDDGNSKMLESYSTIVAYIEDGKAVMNGSYSNTTMRHIRDFFHQNGFELGTVHEMLEMYGN